MLIVGFEFDALATFPLLLSLRRKWNQSYSDSNSRCSSTSSWITEKGMRRTIMLSLKMHAPPLTCAADTCGVSTFRKMVRLHRVAHNG